MLVTVRLYYQVSHLVGRLHDLFVVLVAMMVVLLVEVLPRVPGHPLTRRQTVLPLHGLHQQLGEFRRKVLGSDLRASWLEILI